MFDADLGSAGLRSLDVAQAESRMIEAEALDSEMPRQGYTGRGRRWLKSSPTPDGLGIFAAFDLDSALPYRGYVGRV